MKILGKLITPLKTRLLLRGHGPSLPVITTVGNYVITELNGDELALDPTDENIIAVINPEDTDFKKALEV